MEPASQTDVLTGLPNMTHFKNFAQKLLDDQTALRKGIVSFGRTMPVDDFISFFEKRNAEVSAAN